MYLPLSFVACFVVSLARIHEPPSAEVEVDVSGSEKLECRCDIDTCLSDIEYYTSSDDGYSKARQQLACHSHSAEEAQTLINPSLIVYPSTEEEITSILQFIRDCDYAVAIRSGGHQYGGLSSCNGDNKQCVQISMDKFNHFKAKYDPETNDVSTIVVGAGLTVKQLYAEAMKLGVFIPAGACSDVGVGGHFQTSAMSLFARSFGWGLDYVTRVRLVLSNGTVVDAMEKYNSDLYWVVLGGGPGSFGVVTEYEMKPLKGSDYPNAGAAVLVYEYSIDRFTALSKLILSWFNDDDISNNEAFSDFSIWLLIASRAMLSGGGDDPYTHNIFVQMSWSGKISGVNMMAEWPYETFVNPLLSLEGLIPDATVVLNDGSQYPIPTLLYATTKLRPIFDLSDDISLRYRANALYSDKMLSVDGIDEIAPAFDAMISDKKVWNWFFEAWINTDSDNAGNNALGVRNVAMGYDNWIMWADDSYAETAIAKYDAFEKVFRKNYGEFKQLKGFWHLNGDDLDMNKEWSYYYPNREWYHRLQHIKAAIDPIDLFNNGLTIPLPN